MKKIKSDDKKSNESNSFFAELKDWVCVIIVAFVIALFVNNFIITNSYVPTPSMESTLPVGARLFGFRLHYLFTSPKRGDIVIFDYGYKCKICDKMYQKNDEHKCPTCGVPDSKNPFDKVHFIKRVVGVPGDHIEIKEDYTSYPEMFRELQFKDQNINIPCGHIYINGEKYEEKYLNEPMIVNSFFKPLDIVVPDNSYFLLGDNRNNSEDARFWPNTFIEKKDIESKALFIYWPLNRISIIK